MNEHEIARCLALLKGIEGYPYDEKEDRAFLERKIEAFPQLDPVSVIHHWMDYIAGVPFKKNSRPRAQLGNQWDLALKWGRSTRSAQIATQQVPSVKEQIRMQNERAAARRAELGIA